VHETYGHCATSTASEKRESDILNSDSVTLFGSAPAFQKWRGQFDFKRLDTMFMLGADFFSRFSHCAAMSLSKP